MFCSQRVTIQTRCVLFTGGDGSDQMFSVHKRVTVQTRCVLFTEGDDSDQMCSVHRG